MRRPMVNSRKNSRNQSCERSQHCCRASGKQGGTRLGLPRKHPRIGELTVPMNFYCYSCDRAGCTAGPPKYNLLGRACCLELECRANVSLEDRACRAPEMVTVRGEGQRRFRASGALPISITPLQSHPGNTCYAKCQDRSLDARF